MTTPRTPAQRKIAALLIEQPMSMRDVAFTLGIAPYGVESCMRGMLRRKEIQIVRSETGGRTKYRVTS